MDKKIMNMLILSPAFPTAINGLGDYSYRLGESLSEYSSLRINYAGLPQKEPIQVKPYFTFKKDGGLAEIVVNQAIQVIFLNYSNYGYQKKGVPYWLLKQLKIVKSRGIEIFIFFHELNASSNKPWQSVFWLQSLQKQLYKKLYQICNYCYCSNDRIFNILKENTQNHGLKLKKLGIFSNIPEPEILSDFEKRSNIAVIFGSFGRRKEIYKKAEFLKQFCKDYGINKIIDIGAGDITYLSEKLGTQIDYKGILTAAEIAHILNKVRWGLLDYPDSLLGKSGIFAAYSAFGLSIFNLNTEREKALESLVEGKDYLSNNHYFSTFNSEEASKNISSWYNQRDFHHHIAHIASDLSIK